jgi:Na+/glutamate symporter
VTMMYELNWCGIYMPIWLVCLLIGGLVSLILGKLVQLKLRQTQLLTVDYASSAVILAFALWSLFFGQR